MKSPQEFAMDLWRDMCGLPPLQQRHIPPLSELRKTEWCSTFEQMMRNRILMAGYRYETFAEKERRKPNYKYAQEALKKIQLYLDTGNTENLVDAANYCLLEFRWGVHLRKHFKAQDDSEHAKYLGGIIRNGR